MPCLLTPHQTLLLPQVVQLRRQTHETLLVLFITQRLELLDILAQTQRRQTQLVCDGAAILDHARKLPAAGIILVHNHPSGDVTPSLDDLDVTHSLALAARTFGLLLYDHLIITEHNWFSFRAKNLL